MHANEMCMHANQSTCAAASAETSSCTSAAAVSAATAASAAAASASAAAASAAAAMIKCEPVRASTSKFVRVRMSKYTQVSTIISGYEWVPV